MDSIGNFNEFINWITLHKDDVVVDNILQDILYCKYDGNDADERLFFVYSIKKNGIISYMIKRLDADVKANEFIDLKNHLQIIDEHGLDKNYATIDANEEFTNEVNTCRYFLIDSFDDLLTSIRLCYSNETNYISSVGINMDVVLYSSLYSLFVEDKLIHTDVLNRQSIQVQSNRLDVITLMVNELKEMKERVLLFEKIVPSFLYVMTACVGIIIGRFIL